jgi:hypothetical protein
MGVVEPCKAENRLLKGPNAGRGLLYPVTGYNEVPLRISSLPSIASYVYFTSYRIALEITLISFTARTKFNDVYRESDA